MTSLNIEKALKHLRFKKSYNMKILLRGGSRTAVTSKMELFVITVNGFQQLTIL